jgi:glyoxylase-like metal-dependent hydrolase (beta-lactamase superfamily II)
MGKPTCVIEQRAVPPFMKNGYVVACADTGEAVYIDPGDEAPDLLSWISEHRVRLVAVALTHAHLDHISGVRDVKARHTAPVYLHPNDAPLYEALSKQAAWFGLEYPSAPPVDRLYRDRDVLQIGSLSFVVHHTPGHSPGGVCLQLDAHVFCGDTLFAGSIGRTDLPGGSYRNLLASIRDRLLTLDDDTVLHCGHGPDTTVGEEKESNPFLTGG